MLALFLSACNLAPDYQRPALPVPDSYKEGWVVATPTETPPGSWWEQFGDERLNALEARATTANQSIKAGLARYNEARAIVTATNADLFPTVTATAGTNRQELSKNVARLSPITLFNDNLLQLSTSYELDFWGRIRNLVSAAKSREVANAADLANIGLAIHADLAVDYFTLRGDDAAIKVLDETVVSYQKAFELTNQRFQGGASAEADVDQAQLQLQNARTQAADSRLKRAQLEHAIAVLVGQAPAGFALEARPLDVATVRLPAIAPGLPSTLLERRPDIAFYERLVAAANADIGVARAAWFPVFSLDIAGGFESGSGRNWLTAPSRFWSLGPIATLPLFDAGRINALSDEAHAAYDETAANYRQSVLSAYQEVEDNLTALRQLAQEAQSQQAATTAAERALAQSNNRYSGGVATYLDIVITENQTLQAELASVDVLVRQLNSSVALIKSLGGGWQQAQAENLAEAMRDAEVKNKVQAVQK